MWWRSTRGYQMWTCGECGRLGLAMILDTCPGCGAARPGTEAAAEPAPQPAARPPRHKPGTAATTPRKRTTATRTAKGG